MKSLYVENIDMAPQSLIREDDIEIYTRAVSYRNKVSKLVNKFMSRLKWTPLQHRYTIFENAYKAFKQQKNSNIEQQNRMVERIEERIKTHHTMTVELQEEMQEVLNNTYVKKYDMMYTSVTDKIMNSWREDHDVVPDYINNQHLLKIKILDLANLYGLVGNIELDHGYAFSYQVNGIFTTYF